MTEGAEGSEGFVGQCPYGHLDDGQQLWLGSLRGGRESPPTSTGQQKTKLQLPSGK